MKNTIKLFGFLLLITPNYIFAQFYLSGVIKDIDTQKPLSCAKINFYSNELDTIVFSHEDGSFILSNIPSADNYCIDIYRENYRDFDTCYRDLSHDTLSINALLYSYSSPNYKISDVAKQDVFDLGFACSFYAMDLKNATKNFESNIAIQLYNLDLRFKMANKLQMGFKITPIELSWNRIIDEWTVSNRYKKRYFGASFGLSTYFRYIASTIKSSGRKGLFFDIGAYYSIPYYYAYSDIYTYSKYTTRHIKNYYNDIQAMIRIGYSWCSIYANYRFNDVLIHGYEETPKLSFGIELLLPMSN